jgi:predicted glutamine amidotransferase
LHERDVEGHLFILAELEKIEKNKEKLMTLFIKSDQSFVFSVDPNDLKQAFKNNQTSNESLSERKYQFFHLLVLLYAKSINSLVGKTEYIKDDQYASQLVTSYIFNIRLGLKFKPQSKELQKLFEDIKKKVKSQK